MYKKTNIGKIFTFIVLSLFSLALLSNTYNIADAEPRPTPADNPGAGGLVPCNPTYKGETKTITTADGKSTVVSVLNDDCDYNSLIDGINNGIRYFVYLVTFIAAGMIVYAGFTYFIAAAGDPSKKEHAKKMLWAAFWGLIIVYSAWILVYTIFSKLVVNTDVINPLK